MKVRQAGVDLAAILILIAVQPACHKEGYKEGYKAGYQAGQKENILAGNPNRVVTISSSDKNVSNPCEVDFPVTFLRIKKQHTITWAAEDHDFWVVFDNGSPIGTDNKPIKVASGTVIKPPFPITVSSDGYFTYAVYDSDPSSNPPPSPCLPSTADRDTGVIIKR